MAVHRVYLFYRWRTDAYDNDIGDGWVGLGGIYI